MDSAFLHFTYLGKVAFYPNINGGIDIYECHECYSLVRKGSVVVHLSVHGIS